MISIGSSPLLSIVVITRNEENTIARCLDALLGETAAIAAEIILVDSLSTDATVSIASGYPITILQLSEPQSLCASAGRYVGTRASRGEYVLFVDGDMILVEGWLSKALAAFSNEKVGGTVGRIFWVYPGEALSFAHKDAHPLGTCRSLAGGGLFSRKALERAGTFNPFMKGEEERELGFRICSAGYTLMRTGDPMAYHVNKKKTAFEIDEKAGHFVGVGQIIRRHGLSRLGREIVRTQWLELTLEGILAAGVLFMLLLVVLGAFTLLVISAGAILMLLLLLLLLRGVRRNVLFFRTRVRTFHNLVKGIVLGIPSEDRFTARVTILKS